MPNNCCVYGCTVTSDKNPELSFFLFPKEKKSRQAWLKRIRREDFKPTTNTRVCSRHFLASDIRPVNPNTPVEFQKRKLFPGRVPSLNLRGKDEDERDEKRLSFTSIKARFSQDENSDLSGEVTIDEEPSTSTSEMTMEVYGEATNCHENEIDTLRTQLAALKSQLVSSQKNEEDLRNKLDSTYGKLFRFVNLTNEQVQSYSSLSMESFRALSCYLKRFEPINYWSGTVVTWSTISHDDQLLTCLTLRR